VVSAQPERGIDYRAGRQSGFPHCFCGGGLASHTVFRSLLALSIAISYSSLARLHPPNPRARRAAGFLTDLSEISTSFEGSRIDPSSGRGEQVCFKFHDGNGTANFWSRASSLDDPSGGSTCVF